jgi:hypothetical protein
MERRRWGRGREGENIEMDVRGRKNWEELREGKRRSGCRERCKREERKERRWGKGRKGEDGEKNVRRRKEKIEGGKARDERKRM